MSHKWASIIFGAGFGVLLEITMPVFRFILAMVLVYCLILLTYNFFYLRRHGLWTIWVWLRPIFYIAAIISVYFVLPSGFFRSLFLILSCLSIFVMQLVLRLVSEQVNFIGTLLSFFGISLAIYAMNFYSLQKGIYILIFAGISAFLIARSSFEYIPQTDQKKNFFSLLIAAAIMEIVWASMFLPLHFSALAIILFNAFYVLWIIIYNKLFNNLSAQKVSFHVMFASILISMVILATPWK